MAKQKNYNRGQLGQHHPVQQTKFDTTNHVGRSWAKGQVPAGYGSRTKDVKTKVAPQEKKILEGIASSLQCTESEALRIMLHEFSRRITDGTITSLYNSRKISASQQANDWLKEARATDKPKTDLMEAAKAASEQARIEAEEKAAQEYADRGNYMDMLNAQGVMSAYLDDNGQVDVGAIDYTRQREADALEAELYGAEGEQTKEQFIAQHLSWDLTQEEAEEEWEMELVRRKEAEEEVDEESPGLAQFIASIPETDTVDVWGAL